MPHNYPAIWCCADCAGFHCNGTDALTGIDSEERCQEILDGATALGQIPAIDYTTEDGWTGDGVDREGCRDCDSCGYYGFGDFYRFALTSTPTAGA